MLKLLVNQIFIHAHARDYTKELWRLMTYAEVTFGDLYNGNMRFDVNISVAPEKSDELGAKVEVKNLNSFRSVERVVEYEIKRQVKLLENGEQIRQETRGWNDATGETTGQRTKEGAADYRYMPEPDLPPVRLEESVVDVERAKLPKMPVWYRENFNNVIGPENVEVLLDYRTLMEKLAELEDDAAVKKVANLFSSVLLAEENASLLNDELPSKEQLMELVGMLRQNELSVLAAKKSS